MAVDASACNHQLPCSRIVEGVSHLGGNCSLKHIGDLISSDWISVSQKRDNHGEEQRLQIAANLVEESVTDDKRSLNGARCQLRKLSKLLDYVKATTRVSAELHDLGLEKVKVVGALLAVNAVGGNDNHSEGVMG